jgi:acetylornithine deacetylase
MSWEKLNIEQDSISQNIKQWVDAHAEEAVELAAELVRIYSVNHPPNGNEGAFQRYLAEWLEKEGGEVDSYELSEVIAFTEHTAYRPGRNYQGRPNVLATFRGLGGGGKTLMFSGHADTVYEGTESWTHPPFSGNIVDGKLYGRGAYDMKGGMAASMMAVKCIRELGIPVRGDIFIESVVDEEHGGANGTLAGRLRGTAADMAIIPEPSNLQIYTAHLGGGIWKASFEGKSGLGFAGEELISALEATVSFARLLQEFGQWRNEQYPAPLPWDGKRKLEVSLLSIFSGDPSRELQEKLPSTGELRFWIEGYPGMTGDQIIRELCQFYDSHLDQYPLLHKCKPVITPLIRYLDASEMKLEGLGEQFLQTVSRASVNVLGSAPGCPQGSPFACDGFMFNLHSDTKAIVLGPSGANAHAADEYLDIESYVKLIAWYAGIIADWCE